MFSGSLSPSGPTKTFGLRGPALQCSKGRAALPYRDNIAEIKQKVIADLKPALDHAGMLLRDEVYGVPLIENGLCLSEISDFQGLLPKALAAGDVS